MPEQLDYRPATADDAERPDAAFWFTYFICACVGLFVLSGLLDRLLFGRPGDEAVAWFRIVSILVLTGFLGASYYWLRRIQATHLLCVACFVGLGSFVPAYLVRWLLF